MGVGGEADTAIYNIHSLLIKLSTTGVLENFTGKEKEMANALKTNGAAQGNNLHDGRKTVVGVFGSADPVDEVVREIEALGLSRNRVRTLEEPERFEVSGVMSFPRLDFETQLTKALTIIGATKAEAEAYVGELRRGGALVFATTSSDKEIAAAAEIMDRHGAVGIEKGRGPQPDLPHVARGVDKTPSHEPPHSGGRVGHIPRNGSDYFVW